MLARHALTTRIGKMSFAEFAAPWEEADTYVLDSTHGRMSWSSHLIPHRPGVCGLCEEALRGVDAEEAGETWRPQTEVPSV